MKKMIIAIIIAVTLLVAGIVSTILIINTPSIVMVPTVTSAFSDFMKRDDVKQIQNVLENGSVEFDVLDEESNTDVSGKLYFGLDDYKLMGENIEFKRGDISLSGDFYISKNLCYAQNEEILDGTFGIKSGNAAEEFEKSIFAFGSGSKYAADEETHDSVYEILSALDNHFPDKMKKDAGKLITKYTTSLQNIISKYGEFSSEKGTFKVGTSYMKARMMTLVLDEAAISNIASDFLTLLAEDEGFKDFVYTYGDKLISIFNLTDTNNAAELYAKITDDINNCISNIKNDVKGHKITFDVITPKLSTKLLAFTLTIDKNGVVSTYGADFGTEGVKSSNLITLNLNGTSVEYKLGSDSKSFSVVVEDFAKITYYLDGKDGFELALLLFYEGEERYEISGTVTSDKHLTCYDITNYKYTYKKDGATDFENTVEKSLNIKLSISDKDKMPTPIKEYESFLEIDDERFSTIEQKFVAIFGNKEQE